MEQRQPYYRHAGQTLPAFRAHLESLFGKLLQTELRAAGADRVTILLSEDVPAMADCRHFYGLAESLSLFEPALRRRGLDKARGPVVWINSEKLLNEAGDVATMVPLVAAVVAHEIAHVAAHPPIWAPSKPMELSPTTVAAFQLVPAAASHHLPMRKVERLHHDAAWLRVLFHLHWRLEQRLGWFVPPGWLYSASSYGISRPEIYQRSLESELIDLAVAQIGVLNHVPAPSAFLDLWASDCADAEAEEKGNHDIA